ncbi:MAG: flagellar hook-associated protein FlgL [Gammaproteobacteria bacterium]|nr:flagellar hook-associated protein FlgL [Gammaproteobacteria bacterium]
MRISTNQEQQRAVNAMLEQQKELSRVQQQVATGRRIFQPSDDPVASAKIINLRDVLGTTQQYQDNIAASRARLSMEEGVLGNVTDVLQRIRELTVAGNNDTLTSEDRGFIAEEIKQLLSEVFNLANSSDSTGEFLFSGAKSKFKPFDRNNENGFNYNGDDAQRHLQIAPQRQIATSDSGSEVFRNIKDGNGSFTVLDNVENRGSAIISPGNIVGEFETGTYAISFSKTMLPDGSADLTYKVIDESGQEVVPTGTSYRSGDSIVFKGVNTYIDGDIEDGDMFIVRPSENQDVFTTIQRLINGLEGMDDKSQGRAGLHNEINRTLMGLDNALENILKTRANVGARLNALDGQEEINSSYMLQIRESLSKVEDLDYSEAVSELNLKLTGLEASQKAFTRVQGISLFNYL